MVHIKIEANIDTECRICKSKDMRLIGRRGLVIYLQCNKCGNKHLQGISEEEL